MKIASFSVILKIHDTWFIHVNCQSISCDIQFDILLFLFCLVLVDCDIFIGENAFNSLAPGRFQFDIRSVIFKLTSVNGGWGISCEIALKWMSLDLDDYQSILVQVMAWCRQATSHYLSQCWPRSMSPNGITRTQWVKLSCTASPLYVVRHG